MEEISLHFTPLNSLDSLLGLVTSLYFFRCAWPFCPQLPASILSASGGGGNEEDVVNYKQAVSDTRCHESNPRGVSIDLQKGEDVATQENPSLSKRAIFLNEKKDGALSIQFIGVI